MSDTEMVNFDEPTLERLKVAYEEARIAGKDVFIFEEREYATSYAKYVIQFLEGEFAKRAR